MSVLQIWAASQPIRLAENPEIPRYVLGEGDTISVLVSCAENRRE